MIGEQATYILLRTDLLDAYRIVEKQQQEGNQDTGALALKPGMDTVTLKAAMVGQEEQERRYFPNFLFDSGQI